MLDSIHARRAWWWAVLRWWVTVTACVAISTATALSQQAQLGSWSPGPSGTPVVYDWNAQIDAGCSVFEDYAEISHAALIPIGTCAGKVIMWRRSRDGSCVPTNTTEVWLFSPDNPSIVLLVAQTLQSDLFCAGMSWAPTGRLTAVGGFRTGSLAPLEGYRFDPLLLGSPVWGGDPAYVPGNPWSAPFDMSIGRYYPTLISLDRRGPFGSNCSSFSVPRACQIVLGGPPTISNEGNELWELFHPSLANPVLHTLAIQGGPHQPTSPPVNTEFYALPGPTPAESLLDSYPRAFQLGEFNPQNPSILGQVFVAFDVESDPGNPANTSGSAWVMQPPPATTSTSGCWELWPAPNSANSSLGDVYDRHYAPAVILHQILRKNRVLAFGGSQVEPGEPPGLTVLDRVQEYEPGTIPHSGTWHDKADLNHARVFNNAVVLPTGQVLVLGGSTVDTHHGGIFAPGTWVLTPELYEPGSLPTSSGSTTDMAPHQAPRLYHSVEVLLLDGSVLLAGGHERPNWGAPPSGRTGEVFFPPYFFNGNRPHIDSAPGTITFAPTGSSFSLDVTTFHDHVYSVVLLRPAAVTHHCDYDQRYIELEFSIENVVDGVATLNVTPPHESLGPPGYYTLWVVESKTSGTPTYQDIIPSIAKVVRLQ